jgi:NitT/TauT family transport system permease protein
LASLERLGLGLGIATVTALVVGLVLGVLPPVRATLGPLVTGIAVIPPIALLPILFIALGLGETAKVTLIVIGIAPVMVRDIAAHVAALPSEQLVKAQTLGASSWQIMIRVALPQAMPRLLHAIRLALGPAWVFLISAEAIASDVGLGYRIFLVRRYLSMDIIIPYVAWIALLAILIDVALTILSRRLFPWAHGASH